MSLAHFLSYSAAETKIVVAMNKTLEERQKFPIVNCFNLHGGKILKVAGNRNYLMLNVGDGSSPASSAGKCLRRR